jgi:hypothetical protein
VTRAPLSTILLATLLALVPFAARAGGAPQTDPNDPNSPLGSGEKLPCFDASQVPDALSLEVLSDPNDPNSPIVMPFAGLSDCPSLCKKAGVSCAKLVKRAAACELRFAADRARFKARTFCEGLSGDALKSCVSQYAPALQAQSDAAKSNLEAGLTGCVARASDCAGKCNVAP